MRGGVPCLDYGIPTLHIRPHPSFGNRKRLDIVTLLVEVECRHGK